MTSKIARSSCIGQAWLAGMRSLAIALSWALVLVVAAPPREARAVEPVQVFDVVLLQPGDKVERRVAGGADALAIYVGHLSEAVTQAIAAHPSQIPAAGFIVVAARPAGQVHLWFDFKPELAADTTVAVERSMRAATALPVDSGEVVFALRLSVWGAHEPAAHAPAPKEWRAAAAEAGRKLDVEALVDRLWPE